MKHNFYELHKQVVPSTISGRLRNVLKSSGINVSLFTAHSTRSATTSKASASGWSVIEILERGTWSNMSTWQRFYKKDIISIRVENFQDSVMGGTKWRCEQRKETWALVRWSVGLKIAVLDRAAILWNKILELLKCLKCLLNNSDFMNEIKERSNTGLPPSPWKI